jgi:hypothetical protein
MEVAGDSESSLRNSLPHFDIVDFKAAFMLSKAIVGDEEDEIGRLMMAFEA